MWKTGMEFNRMQHNPTQGGQPMFAVIDIKGGNTLKQTFSTETAADAFAKEQVALGRSYLIVKVLKTIKLEPTVTMVNA